MCFPARDAEAECRALREVQARSRCEREPTTVRRAKADLGVQELLAIGKT